MFGYIKDFIFAVLFSTLITVLLLYAFLMMFQGYTIEQTNQIIERELYYAKHFIQGTEGQYENHLINQKMKKTELSEDRIAVPVVCVLDTDDNDHYAMVNSFLAEYYKGETRFYENNTHYFDLEETENEILLECDIINYSSGILLDSIDETSAEETYIKDFLSRYEGIVVASAGNSHSKDTLLQQEFARVRRDHPEFSDQIIIVGQTGDKNTEAFGKSIDIVVPNDGYVYKGEYQLTGTSFASPVITGVIANLMAVYPDKGAGWYKERVLQHTETFTETIDGTKYRYPLLNIETIYTR